MLSIALKSCRLLLVLTVIAGVVYPAVVTLVAQLVFPAKACGSIVRVHGVARGSTLIGQPFSSPRYFWPRPSATAPYPYNAAASAGSNLGPLNPALTNAIAQRIAALCAYETNGLPLPADLVTASGSGLDPHLSPAAALYQVPRVAAARGMQPDRLRALVMAHVEPRTLGLLGEPRVNVLGLNLALDAERQGF